MHNVARRGCDVAGDVRQHRLRCRSTPGRHRSWWRGAWPSDVAMSYDVRGRGSDVGATYLRRRAMSLGRLGRGSDAAMSLRRRATPLATSLVGAGRATIRQYTRGLMFYLCPRPPPLWASLTRGRLGDIAQAVSEVARPLRPRERCCDIARAPSDVAQRCWRAMLRCCAMLRGRPSDVPPSPRRPSDIARASSDIATSLQPGASSDVSEIAPLPERHRYIANVCLEDYTSGSSNTN